MTRLRGSSVSVDDEAPASGGKSILHRSKLPPNSPEVIVRITVDVTDPSLVLAYHREERRRQFNLLVRKYVSDVVDLYDMLM